MVELSRGVIEEICQGGNPSNPVLQILGYKKIPGGPQDRYRLLLSDGIHTHSSAMLANQLNGMVVAGELEGFTVIRLDKYVCNNVSEDKRVIIVLEVTVVKKSAEVGGKIGNPQAYKINPGSRAVKEDKTEPDTSSHRSPPSNRMAPQARPFKTDAPNTPGDTQKVHPIATLTPYQNRWQIRARLTQKTPIRTWSNSRGEGKLFSMVFSDESGEIRATGFNEAVDRFYDTLEVNKVYYVTKCTLKTANKQYSTVQNDYEMTFNSDTQITVCDDAGDVPSINFNFTPIGQIGEVEPSATVDVIGVVTHASDVSTIITKATNKELTKRELTVVDKSGTRVSMTLWGSEAEKYEDSGNPIVAVKGVRVSDFGGRSLSVTMSSQLVWNPDIKEAHALRGWFDQEGCKQDFSSFKSEGGSGGYETPYRIMSELKGGNIGVGDKADYSTVMGTILLCRKENCLYVACPSESCNKKLVDTGYGGYRCEKCNKEYDSYKWRLILSANIADFSGNHWITCFQEAAESFLGISANDLGHLRQTDEEAFDRVFTRVMHSSHMFKLRSKVEVYNDEPRLKSVGMQCNEIDYPDYNKHLISEIEKLLV